MASSQRFSTPAVMASCRKSICRQYSSEFGNSGDRNVAGHNCRSFTFSAVIWMETADLAIDTMIPEHAAIFFRRLGLDGRASTMAGRRRERLPAWTTRNWLGSRRRSAAAPVAIWEQNSQIPQRHGRKFKHKPGQFNHNLQYGACTQLQLLTLLFDLAHEHCRRMVGRVLKQESVNDVLTGTGKRNCPNHSENGLDGILVHL